MIAAFAGRRALAIFSYALLALAYVTVLLYALHPTSGDNGEWTNNFVQFQFFCTGTLIALLLRGTLVRLPLPLRGVGILLGLGCWFTALLRLRVQSWEPHPTPVGAVLGWLLVLAGAVILFLCAHGIPSRFIPRWLVYLGRISYGLYLFHSLIFFLTFEKALPYLRRLCPGIALPESIRDHVWTLVVLALTIAASSLSFHYFERPFLRLNKRFTFIAAREEVAPSA